MIDPVQPKLSDPSATSVSASGMSGGVSAGEPGARILTFARLPSTSPPDPDYIDPSTLTIDADLSSLLSSEPVRKRYSAGRYIQDKNVSLRIPSYSAEMSRIAGSIQHYAHSPVGIGTIASLAMHIGCLHMARWESIKRLAALVDDFHRDQAKLSELSIEIKDHLIQVVQPRELPTNTRSFTVPIFVSDALGDLHKRGFHGATDGTVASYAMMIVLANQTDRCVNPSDRKKLLSRARELEVMLEVKVLMLEEAMRRVREIEEGGGEASKTPRGEDDGG